MSGYWQEKMEMGVPVLDADHRRIAEIFDCLHVALKAGAGTTSVSAILADLVEVMCEHIDREEELMQLIHYQAAPAHIRDHEVFIFMLSLLMVDYQTNNRHIASDAASLIERWQSGHLLLFDQPLAAAARAAVMPAAS